MAVDVGSNSMVRAFNAQTQHRDELQHPRLTSANSDVLITKDFLGCLSNATDNQSDLDFNSMRSADRRRCDSPNSPLSPSSSPLISTDDTRKKNSEKKISDSSELQDLNSYYSQSPRPCLDLKLQSSTYCQSVCTIDKVRFALQRAAEKEQPLTRKRPSSPPVQSSSSSTAMFAAGCPGCLLYVVTFKENPKCPRCNSIVPFPGDAKKPRLDLNSLL